MPTIKELAESYGVSKSTMRRRVLEVYPDIASDGGVINLTAAQVSAIADHMGKRGAKLVQQHEPNESAHDSVVERQEPVESVRESAESVPLEQYETVVESLKRCIESLENQLESKDAEIERLHEALKREQMTRLGFWGRLGQKLLGSGAGE